MSLITAGTSEQGHSECKIISPNVQACSVMSATPETVTTNCTSACKANPNTAFTDWSGVWYYSIFPSSTFGTGFWCICAKSIP